MAVSVLFAKKALKLLDLPDAYFTESPRFVYREFRADERTSTFQLSEDQLNPDADRILVDNPNNPESLVGIALDAQLGSAENSQINFLKSQRPPRYITMTFETEKAALGPETVVSPILNGENMDYTPMNDLSSFNSDEKLKEYINTEANVASEFDVPFYFRDSTLRSRMAAKLRTFAKLHHVDMQLAQNPGNISPQQKSYLSDLVIEDAIRQNKFEKIFRNAVDYNKLLNITSIYSNPELQFVNDAGRAQKTFDFGPATNLSLASTIACTSFRSLYTNDIKAIDFGSSFLDRFEEALLNQNVEANNERTQAYKEILQEVRPLFTPAAGAEGEYRDPILFEEKSLGLVRLPNRHISIVPFSYIERSAVEHDDNLRSTVRSLNGLINQALPMLVGYFIQRKELLPDGTITESEFLVKGDSRTATFIDVNIKYGGTYTYCVAPLYHVLRKGYSVNAPDLDDSARDIEFNIVKVKEEFLLKGQSSVEKIVRCIDVKPPEAPPVVFYNLNMNNNNSLLIDWRHPVNPQRDIKYFQVFRRKSVNDPFTCIALLDFDDSEILSIPTERVTQKNIIRCRNPIMHYEDTEIKPGDSCIYAIASVDAHGLTSAYSAQTLVKKSYSGDAITTQIISQSGAPKQYPNFYIDPELDPDVFTSSLTQDAIFTSGFHEMRVYLDPDCRIAYNRSHADASNMAGKRIESIKVLKTKNNDDTVYKLHFINTDRQKSDSIEFSLNAPSLQEIEAGAVLTDAQTGLPILEIENLQFVERLYSEDNTEDA